MSPVEIWSRIYELEFNYVLVDNNTYALIAKKLVTPYVSSDFVVNKIFDEQDFSLYEVKSKKHKYNWSTSITKYLRSFITVNDFN